MDEKTNMKGWDRRSFLKSAGVGVLGISIAPLSGCDAISVEPITLGTEIPFLTPISNFYEKVGAEVSIANWTQPEITKNDWSLQIDGLVDTPISVSYADLEREISDGNFVDLLKTLRCVIDSNEIQGLIGTAIWRGVPLRTFLDRAGVDQGAINRIRLYGSDGFTNNLKANRAFIDGSQPYLEPLLVTQMNGQELPQRFGGPVRLIVYETFGYKNIKWLQRVEATADNANFGTYQDAGFFDSGEMQLSSRITNPINRSTISAGSFQIQGFAVTGGGPVEAVELTINGVVSQAEIIPLEELLLEDPLLSNFSQKNYGASFPYDNVWIKWRFNWDASPGTYSIRITAIDNEGQGQPVTDSEISDGINAMGSIEITVV